MKTDGRSEGVRCVQVAQMSKEWRLNPIHSRTGFWMDSAQAQSENRQILSQRMPIIAEMARDWVNEFDVSEVLCEPSNKLRPV